MHKYCRKCLTLRMRFCIISLINLNDTGYSNPYNFIRRLKNPGETAGEGGAEGEVAINSQAKGPDLDGTLER